MLALSHHAMPGFGFFTASPRSREEVEMVSLCQEAPHRNRTYGKLGRCSQQLHLAHSGGPQFESGFN